MYTYKYMFEVSLGFLYFYIMYNLKYTTIHNRIKLQTIFIVYS